MRNNILLSQGALTTVQRTISLQPNGKENTTEKYCDDLRELLTEIKLINNFSRTFNINFRLTTEW